MKSLSMVKPRIIFLNQVTGPLFRELAEELSKVWPPAFLITGHYEMTKESRLTTLKTIDAPKYNRTNYISRLFTWVKYFIFAFYRCWSLPDESVLFLVSNPPFLGLLGYLFKRLRGQRYVVLVYDIHPDLLISFGKLWRRSPIAIFWRRMNRLIWENAEVVFTIGDRMAENLARSFDVSRTTTGKIAVVPNWADTSRIYPVAKEENRFAKEHNQVDTVTVMYSGNLGQTHDIESILAAAGELKDNRNIHFMIIGDGAKKKLVEQEKLDKNLDNLIVLPYQPEDMLPLSLTTADIAIVTLAKGSEALMVPSKTYYAMAAGSALIGLCSAETEIADTIKKHNCGLVVEPGDVESLVKAILQLSTDKERLNELKANSRNAAENFYSRKNVEQYIDALTKASLP